MVGHVVKWTWWYPEGSIRAPGLEEHVVDHLISIEPGDGENIAADIVDDFISNNHIEGDTFEIEISEPASIAGVYDVQLEWTPHAVAERRKAVVIA